MRYMIFLMIYTMVGLGTSAGFQKTNSGISHSDSVFIGVLWPAMISATFVIYLRENSK